MVRVGEKKRSAAVAQRSDGSWGEESDEEAKRPASVRAPSGRNRDPINVPVLAGNKAAAPQKAAAANVSVVAENKDANKATRIGHYDNFVLQMQQIEQTKPSKAADPVVTSPNKFGSPGRPKSHKVWVAGLKSGEMVAYVTDRHRPEAPAYIKLGLDRFREDPQLCEKATISAIYQKKADKEPFKAWSETKVSAARNEQYKLYWYVLVRTFDDLTDHTPEARIKWGELLASLFSVLDKQNKFEYGGDLSTDQSCPASAFFKVQDVMEKFIMKRLAGQMSESEIVQNSHLMASYYGDDPVLNRKVIQFYMPNEQQVDDEVNEDEANLNRELSALF
jgi:hypothetical protein